MNWYYASEGRQVGPAEGYVLSNGKTAPSRSRLGHFSIPCSLFPAPLFREAGPCAGNEAFEETLQRANAFLDHRSQPAILLAVDAAKNLSSMSI